MRKRIISVAILVLLLSGLFSSCRFESAAEHESRLNAIEGLSTELQQTSQITESTQVSGEDPGTGQAPAGDGTSAGHQQGIISASQGQQPAATDVQATTTPGSQGGEGTPLPPTAANPAPAPTAPQSFAVIFSVSCKNALGHNALKDGIVLPPDGMILHSTSITVKAGTTIFEALQTVCAKNDVYLGYKSSAYGKYVEQIGPLQEKDCGAQSGWTYLVNGVTPSYSADFYKIKGSITVEWVYVTHT